MSTITITGGYVHQADADRAELRRTLRRMQDILDVMFREASEQLQRFPQCVEAGDDADQLYTAALDALDSFSDLYNLLRKAERAL